MYRDSKQMFYDFCLMDPEMLASLLFRRLREFFDRLNLVDRLVRLLGLY